MFIFQLIVLISLVQETFATPSTIMMPPPPPLAPPSIVVPKADSGINIADELKGATKVVLLKVVIFFCFF